MDDDDPFPPDDHHTVDLLALQQEIIQQTASIQMFFASLAPLIILINSMIIDFLILSCKGLMSSGLIWFAPSC